MVKATFEFEGNSGFLTITTHFNDTYVVKCEKQDDEIFRLGGTAVNDVVCHEGVILKIDNTIAHFKAFHNDHTFEGNAILSSEPWDDSDLHCWITEFYDLYMEGKKPGWIVSKNPIQDANYLFINLDILDGGGNIIKRYRASPFVAQYRLMELIGG